MSSRPRVVLDLVYDRRISSSVVSVCYDCDFSRGKLWVRSPRCSGVTADRPITTFISSTTYWPRDSAGTNRTGSEPSGYRTRRDRRKEYSTSISMQILPRATTTRCRNSVPRVFRPWPPGPRIACTRYASREFRTLSELWNIFYKIL